MINLTTKDGEPWMLHEKDIADIRQIEDEGYKDGCIVYFLIMGRYKIYDKSNN